MARGEAGTFWALVKTTVFLLVAFLSTDETGITVSGMGWKEDRVGLVVESFPPVCSVLGFLGAQVSNLFVVRGWDGGRGDR